MNSSGNILTLEQVKALSEAEQKGFIPIPDKELKSVQIMTRQERQQWFRDTVGKKFCFKCKAMKSKSHIKKCKKKN